MARWMVCGRRRFGRDQAVELGVDGFLLPRQVFAKVHVPDFSGRKGSADHLAVAADQHFDARFGLFQLLAAGVAEPHAALEEFKRAFEREIAGFQLLDDFFEFVETGFKRCGGRRAGRGFGHWQHSNRGSNPATMERRNGYPLW